VVLEGRIFVVGGEATTGLSIRSKVIRSGSDRWTASPALPTPRHGLGAAIHAGRMRDFRRPDAWRLILGGERGAMPLTPVGRRDPSSQSAWRSSRWSDVALQVCRREVRGWLNARLRGRLALVCWGYMSPCQLGLTLSLFALLLSQLGLPGPADARPKNRRSG
jgi:hypothetical protein